MRCLVMPSLAAITSGSLAAAEPCRTIAPEAAEILAGSWFSAFKAKQPDALAAHYAPDAVILSPGAGLPVTKPHEVLRHLDRLTASFSPGEIRARAIKVGCGTIADYGQLELVRRTGTRETLVVLYSRIYELRLGSWLVTIDHMSLEAGGLSAAADARGAARTSLASRIDRAAAPSDRATLDDLVRAIEPAVPQPAVQPSPRVAGVVMLTHEEADGQSQRLDEARADQPWRLTPARPARRARDDGWKRRINGFPRVE
ncbi:MAG: hypothetical protein ACFCUN_14435 [Hyphomicrobiaceae bacterium]